MHCSTHKQGSDVRDEGENRGHSTLEGTGLERSGGGAGELT